jgi:hypothetical protein
VRDQAGVGSTEAVRHLQRVEPGLGAHVRGELPADDHAAVAVEDESEVEEAIPGTQIGDVAHPLLVRRRRGEVALEQIAGALDRGLVRDRRPMLAATPLALDPMLAHDAGDLVATDVDPAPAQLKPGLAGAVDAAVAGARGLDLFEQLAVGKRATGRLPGPARVVSAHRHLEHAADRLDPEGSPPLLDVGGHLRRVGSSSVAK